MDECKVCQYDRLVLVQYNTGNQKILAHVCPKCFHVEPVSQSKELTKVEDNNGR